MKQQKPITFSAIANHWAQHHLLYIATFFGLIACFIWFSYQDIILSSEPSYVIDAHTKEIQIYHSKNLSIQDSSIFIAPEQVAVFVGGRIAFNKHIIKNIKYPRDAYRKGITGKVSVSFVVEKDGSLSNIKILKGIGGGCNEEALRIIQISPKWKPAQHQAKTVRQRLVRHITFAI